MTLDEAIAHAREVTEDNNLQGMLCHANPNDEKLDDCIKCGKEHEQIADWLEELKQYRSIGIVEECRAAVEKQTAAKPLGGMDIEGNEYAICRECSAILSDGKWFAQYCPDCGQKLDWREKE